MLVEVIGNSSAYAWLTQSGIESDRSELGGHLEPGNVSGLPASAGGASQERSRDNRDSDREFSAHINLHAISFCSCPGLVRSALMNVTEPRAVASGIKT